MCCARVCPAARDKLNLPTDDVTGTGTHSLRAARRLTAMLKNACLAQDVSEIRPRDGDARIAWLLERRRFRQALAIAETDSTLVLLNFEQARSGRVRVHGDRLNAVHANRLTLLSSRLLSTDVCQMALISCGH